MVKHRGPQTFHPASMHWERLHASRLYRVREQAARETRVRARLAAWWYLDSTFKPRYHGDPT